MELIIYKIYVKFLIRQFQFEKCVVCSYTWVRLIEYYKKISWITFEDVNQNSEMQFLWGSEGRWARVSEVQFSVKPFKVYISVIRPACQ